MHRIIVHRIIVHRIIVHRPVYPTKGMTVHYYQTLFQPFSGSVDQSDASLNSSTNQMPPSTHRPIRCLPQLIDQSDASLNSLTNQVPASSLGPSATRLSLFVRDDLAALEDATDASILHGALMHIYTYIHIHTGRHAYPHTHSHTQGLRRRYERGEYFTRLGSDLVFLKPRDQLGSTVTGVRAGVGVRHPWGERHVLD